MPSATANLPSPDVPELDTPGRVAIVGAGAFGRFCLEAYRKTPDIKVTHIADPDPSALAQIDAPDVRKARSWEAIVADESVEVLHLATPPYVRTEIAFAALEAGKSLFCEKPLALTLAEADAMIETAERRGVALGVDYVMRHQLAYCLLEALASSGQFGKLRTICFQNYAQAVPAGHWFWDVRRSGGILVEHGVHFFDAYGRLAGKPVCLWGASPKPEAVEVTIQYEDGAIGRYYHEFAFPREVERAASTVFFARGWVEIDGWIPTRLHGAVLAPPEPLWMEASALGIAMSVARNEATHFEALFGDRQVSYQAGIVAGLRDTIRRHRDPGHRMEVTPQEARASLALALAGQRAAESGTPVRLAA